MQRNLVSVVVTYRAQPGQGERTNSELAELIAAVVAGEPDCLGILLHVDPDDETRFLLYEQWTSSDAYAGPHMQTAHLQAFIARSREFLAGPPSIEFWDVLSETRP